MSEDTSMTLDDTTSPQLQDDPMLDQDTSTEDIETTEESPVDGEDTSLKSPSEQELDFEKMRVENTRLRAYQSKVEKSKAKEQEYYRSQTAQPEPLVYRTDDGRYGEFDQQGNFLRYISDPTLGLSMGKGVDEFSEEERGQAITQLKDEVSEVLDRPIFSGISRELIGLIRKMPQKFVSEDAETVDEAKADIAQFLLDELGGDGKGKPLGRVPDGEANDATNTPADIEKQMLEDFDLPIKQFEKKYGKYIKK